MLLLGLSALVLAVSAASETGHPLLFVSDASYPPITYLDRGTPRGVAVDIVQALGRRMHRPIEIRMMPWQEAQDMVLRGEADALFPMSITEARRQTYDFSEPLLDLQFAIFTRASRAGIAGMADLPGLRVGVTSGGLPRQLLQPDPRIRLVIVEEYSAGFQMLKDGRLDAVVADRWVGTYELAERGIDGVKISPEPVANLQGAVAVKRGRAAELAAINAALRQIRADGTLARIIQDWQPKEVLFLTREQVNRWGAVAAFGLLLLLLGVVVTRVIDLRRKVAAHRAAENRINTLNQRLSLATRAAGIGIWDWEVPTNVLIWDDEMHRLFGSKRENFNGAYEAWVRALHPADQERAQAEVQDALRSRKPFHTEFRIIRADGAVRTIKALAEVFVGPDGRPQRMVGVNYDITEQKELEEKFLRAQRLDAIGTLAGGIAHDLNNVLAPILTAVQLLQMDLSPERRARLLETLESSAQRGAGMIRQVLMFVRGVDGDRVRLNPPELVREIEHMIRDTFPRAIVIESAVAADCSPVLGDATQLQQVLLNLCVNARDAMPGGGRLTLIAANVPVDASQAGRYPGARPGPHVLLQVTDTGGGIPPAISARIFDPFFTTKGQGQGTGLGLSTVQAIVKSHGGFVQVDSEPGRGSTFKILLPAAGGETAESAPPASEPPSGALPRGNGELVLIVDDEETIRQVTKNTLEAFGYRVLLAQNGAEAVALFTEHGDVAVVLIDMMMPVMDGSTAILAMHRIRPDAPVIATSGLTSMRDLAASIPGKVKHHLQKPYTAEKLLQTIHQALQS
ncbi:PAS domain S-box-containing protein [Opitutus sp. GAS368]|nr:PAS domain S-box-containing protein [Opitutus sp. GAS368]